MLRPILLPARQAGRLERGISTRHSPIASLCLEVFKAAGKHERVRFCELALAMLMQVPARWSFIALPDFGEETESQPQSPFPAWVSVFPETGVMEPFAEQQLAVSVNAERARLAVQGQPSRRVRFS